MNELCESDDITVMCWCVSVVGSPLEVARVVDPTEDDVSEVHQRYISHLVSLFEAHKTNHGISPEQHLNIVWLCC